MSKIIVCRGLPASGKSTWSKEYVQLQNHSGVPTVRVNRDNIRQVLMAPYSEDTVKTVERNNIVSALNDGKDVVIDDTNIYSCTAYLVLDAILLSSQENITIEIKNFMDIPIETCLERNSHRENPVPEVIILNFFEYYKNHGTEYMQVLKNFLKYSTIFSSKLDGNFIYICKGNDSQA